MNIIKAKKLKMTQIWEDTNVIPVTVLLCETPKEGEGSLFEKGEKVNVSSLSKGRGFQGVVKRYGFGGGPKTHGQKDRHRAPGSSGPTAPQRVIKGRKMAGHMGNVRVTVKNLKVVSVDTENNLVMLKGAVPGNKGSSVEIRKKNS